MSRKAIFVAFHCFPARISRSSSWTTQAWPLESTDRSLEGPEEVNKAFGLLLRRHKMVHDVVARAP